MTGKEIGEQFAKLGIDGLKEVGNWVNGAKDFVVEQAPLICQEIVARGLVTASIWLSVFVILGGIFLYLLFYGRKKFIATKDDSYAFLAVLSVVAIFGMFCGIMYNLYMILYIQFCQRLYVLEELAKIVKQYTK